MTLNRTLVKTADGSYSIHIEDWNESYHSKHGAIQEALHVFIKMGLDQFNQQEQINLLEIGFGTGLNTLITFIQKPHNQIIKYTGIEKYPVLDSEWKHLHYPEQLNVQKTHFDAIHNSPWGDFSALSSSFQLRKLEMDFKAVDFDGEFDLVYFDAFGPRVQPALWEEGVFIRMLKALKPKGILVTYCAKGAVRRTMQQVGFKVERLPGPPGKREMLRATKPIDPITP